MKRVNWKCPGCKRSFRVPTAEGLFLCPDCRVEPAVKDDPTPVKKKTSGLSASDYGFIAVGSAVLILFAIWVGRNVMAVVPTKDPEKLLVETWLRENLETGKWEEVRWYPAATPRNLFDINLQHIIEAMEKAKIDYENGRRPTDDQLAFQQHYYKYLKSPVRTFAAIKYRTATINQQSTILYSQVFETTSGVAKPCPGNEIVELDLAPIKPPMAPR